MTWHKDKEDTRLGPSVFLKIMELVLLDYMMLYALKL